jgi:tRNA uridine 5-carboxymethylaminomethyl modification enzyme
MFTSRAEYRLLLREDNADLRLMEKGRELGLMGEDTVRDLKERQRQIVDELQRLERVRIRPTVRVNEYLRSRGSARLDAAVSPARLLKRPELSYSDLVHLEGRRVDLPEQVVRQVEIQCKYEGYLRRQEAEVKRFKDLERMHIPASFGYREGPGLSHEVRQRLEEIQPESLGQASRIAGMTPAAISILMVYLKRFRDKGQVVETASDAQVRLEIR